MNSNKIMIVCVALFALAGTARGQVTSDSNSGSTSDSSASSGNSVITGSGNSKATSTSSLRGSGNSSVSVSVTIPAASTTAGTSASTNASSAQVVDAAAGQPGTSAYNTASQDNVSYSGTQTVKTNPAIQAPSLTTTLSDTCMGSVSFGFSAPGFGATAGSTLVDQACVRRLDAREFRAMGLADVALALLCQSDANRRAVEATGHLCPGTTAPLAKAVGEVSPMANVSDDVKYRDPLVRDRLGLPRLDQDATAKVPAPTPAAAPAQAATPTASPAADAHATPSNPPATQPVEQAASAQNAQAPAGANSAAQPAEAAAPEAAQTMPVANDDVKVEQSK